MKPNILFILLDACRADKFYNNKNSATPIIDSLIKKGAYFSQAISSTDYTISAISSIFTSRYPFGVGETKEHYYKLHSDSTSYIDNLKKEGYHCYATMHEAVEAMGFSSYFENTDQSYPSGFLLHNGLGGKILEMLKSKRMVEPWIYFIHIEDLHRPIRIPDFEKVSINTRYDRMMEIIDSWLGKILDIIDIETTLLVITADHGDYIPVVDDTTKEFSTIIQKTKSLIKNFIPKSQRTNIHRKKKILHRKIRASKLKTQYEKRSLNVRPDEIRYQFDELIRVPLLFFGFGIKSKKIISNLVRSIDIFPTIEEIINLSDKKTKVHGRSLFPLIEGHDMKELPVYMESTTISTGQKAPKAVIGIRTSSYKFFRGIKNSNDNKHLYDLKTDPFEENNLVEEKPDKVVEMEKILETIRKETKFQSKPEKYEAEEEKLIEKELKKLGYI